MKHSFRIILGLLLLAIPLCINAQEQVDRTPKISGFVQGLYQANLNSEGELTSNTLRMRRVRMSIDGKLTKNLSYKIQGDFSRSPMLVDAYVKYKACDAFAIQIGQFKTPFSLESPINPVNLEVFDYGESIQNLVGYGDVCGVGGLGRDLGVMATGELFRPEGKDFAIVNYAIGVFNGNGPNALDNNNRKDIVGRLEIHPMLKDLTLSGSYYYGLYRNKDVEAEMKKIENNEYVWGDKLSLDEFNNGTRNRWSAGIQYNDGDLVIRGEFLNGTTDYVNITNDTANMKVTNTPMVCQSIGYYGVAGYNFKFGKENSQKLMPVLRYEHFAKNKEIINSGTNYYTVGINYWPVKSLNIKLDYSFIQQESGKNEHRIVGIVSYKF